MLIVVTFISSLVHLYSSEGVGVPAKKGGKQTQKKEKGARYFN
jgi:hypothetical protein